MDFSSLFGAAGSIIGGIIQSNAIGDATRMQVDALNQARQFVYNNLNPDVVNAQATAANIQNAWGRLALQGEIDPALLTSRYVAEQNMLQQAQEIGKQSDKVASETVKEALSGQEGLQASKQALIDKALEQLKAGATLPPDVQNELVKAGLEQSGMVTQAASGKGVGGQLLRTILGTAGQNLQFQRQTHAANLINQANTLESSRQNILQSLFPRLAQTQMANLSNTQSVLSASNAMQPAYGMTGSDVANLWLARVGATNQLSTQAAQVGAQGILGQGQLAGNMVGSAFSGAGSLLNGWLTSNTRNPLDIVQPGMNRVG